VSDRQDGGLTHGNSEGHHAGQPNQPDIGCGGDRRGRDRGSGERSGHRRDLYDDEWCPGDHLGRVVLTAAVPATTAHADTIVTFPVAAGTTTTFDIPSGPLSITAPAATLLGATAPSGTVTTPLGDVTVTDARALLAPTWTATVSSTDFTTGSATPAETIANTDVTYWSGPATAISGSGVTFIPGQPTSADQVPLSSAPTVCWLTSGIGINSASWNPTITVQIPASGIAGLYTGTVTHSAA
jgi:hypothetical protein